MFKVFVFDNLYVKFKHPYNKVFTFNAVMNHSPCYHCILQSFPCCYKKTWMPKNNFYIFFRNSMPIVGRNGTFSKSLNTSKKVFFFKFWFCFLMLLKCFWFIWEAKDEKRRKKQFFFFFFFFPLKFFFIRDVLRTTLKRSDH